MPIYTAFFYTKNSLRKEIVDILGGKTAIWKMCYLNKWYNKNIGNGITSYSELK